MSKQRPFWPAAILPAGNLIASVFRSGHGYDFPPSYNEPALMWLGTALELFGVLLLVRYFVVTFRKHRLRTKAL